MPVNVFGEGAVQTAYVGFRAFNLDVDTQLFWPNAFQDTVDVAAAFMRVIAPIGPINLILPDATQVSVGQNFIIFNAGAADFNLQNNAGGDIGAIEVGKMYYFILRNNTTAAGIWINTTFGTGTSEADANALAGLGLIASGPRLDTNVHVVTTDGPVFAIDDGNNADLIVWNGGAGTINLPPVGSVVAGFLCSFNNNGTGEIILKPNIPAETIDGLVELPLGLDQSVTLVTDHVKWYTLGLGKQTFSAVSILQKTVSGNVNVTLTADEATKTIIQFNGLLTGNIKVYFPVIVGEWNLYNATTGAFALRVQLAGDLGASYVIPPGGRQIFYSNGTSSLFDIPTVINVSTATFPSGDAANPGIAFTDSPTTGFFYNNGVPDLGVSVSGVEIANFQASGIKIADTKTLKLSNGAPNTTLSTEATSAQLRYASGGRRSDLQISNPGASGTKLSLIPNTAGNASLDIITTTAGTTFLSGNLVTPTQFNINGAGDNSTLTLSVPGTPTLGTASIALVNPAALQLHFENGANNGTVNINGTAVQSKVEIVSAAFASPALTLISAAAIATISYNGVVSISISSTGVVSFSQRNPTLTALMPVSVAGAMAYFDGTNWLTLAPGNPGDTLKMAGGIPTWTP